MTATPESVCDCCGFEKNPLLPFKIGNNGKPLLFCLSCYEIATHLTLYPLQNTILQVGKLIEPALISVLARVVKSTTRANTSDNFNHGFRFAAGIPEYRFSRPSAR